MVLGMGWMRASSATASTPFRICKAITQQSRILQTSRHLHNSAINWRKESSSGDGSDNNKNDDDKSLSTSTSTAEESSSAPITKNFNSKTGRKGSTTKEEDPHQTVIKTRLNNLLQSIMKDQEQRNKSAAQQKPVGKEIEFKLARKEAIRPTPEEILAAEEDKATAKHIGREMLTAVKNVAKSMPGGGDPQVVESELVKKLKSHSDSKINLTQLFEGMKVDSERPETPPVPVRSGQPDDADNNGDHSRARWVRKEMGRSATSNLLPERKGRGRSAQDVAELTYRPIDIFGAKPLGIFTKGKLTEKESSAPISYLKTWDALYQKDLKLAVTHPPANGFEEMILWTEQGKLWHFPIDNEQGLDIEAKSSFAEHVFLEPNLEPWCPSKGPIRHFMELVCIGLSKNPYLTVHEKKEQIEWYHQYFLNQASIIKDVGAGEIK